MAQSRALVIFMLLLLGQAMFRVQWAISGWRRDCLSGCLTLFRIFFVVTYTNLSLSVPYCVQAKPLGGVQLKCQSHRVSDWNIYWGGLTLERGGGRGGGEEGGAGEGELLFLKYILLTECIGPQCGEVRTRKRFFAAAKALPRIRHWFWNVQLPVWYL